MAKSKYKDTSVLILVKDIQLVRKLFIDILLYWFIKKFSDR